MPENFPSLLLGWVIGLFSPLIVDEFRKWRSQGEIEAAIRREFDELRIKLIGLIYLTSLNLGTFDRTLLNWMLPIAKKYKGAHDHMPFAKGCALMSTFTDSELAAYVASQRATESGLAMKKYSVPYLESKLDQLGIFPEKFQSGVLAVKMHLELINQEIDIARFCIEKTFDASVNDENMAILKSNLRRRYAFAVEGSIDTVDLINKLEGM